MAHRTRESFMRAVSRYHGRGDRDTHAPAPIPDGYQRRGSARRVAGDLRGERGERRINGEP